ncbi:YbjQ family protein [Planctomycetales bacterium ZRK34]|nr:YbjQ family protein [Planctomycetales bacterium ZRK34]
MTGLLINIGIPILLLIIGLLAGRAIARRHDQLMNKRQPAVDHMRMTDVKTMPDAQVGPTDPMLITAEITLSVDYFNGFIATLVNLVGGEMRMFTHAMVRARREAMLRLLEDAQARGYNAIANVRIDFADIGGNSVRRKGTPKFSILAYGTAYHASAPAQQPLISA